MNANKTIKVKQFIFETLFFLSSSFTCYKNVIPHWRLNCQTLERIRKKKNRMQKVLAIGCIKNASKHDFANLLKFAYESAARTAPLESQYCQRKSQVYSMDLVTFYLVNVQFFNSNLKCLCALRVIEKYKSDHEMFTLCVIGQVSNYF